MGTDCDLISQFTLNTPPIFSPSASNFGLRKYQDVSSPITFTKIGGSSGTMFTDNDPVYQISNNDLYDPETDS